MFDKMTRRWHTHHTRSSPLRRRAGACRRYVGASLQHTFLLLSRAIRRRRARRARGRARLGIRRAARAWLDGMNDRLSFLCSLSFRLRARWLRRGDTTDKEVVEPDL